MHRRTSLSRPTSESAAELPLPSGEPARSRRVSVLEGSFAQVHITIVTGSLVTAYALSLGATDFHLGLIAALTALAALGAVLAGHWLGHLGRRKPLTLVSSVAGRGLWGLLCVLPFLSWSGNVKLALFLAVVFLGHGLTSAAGTAWLSWMTDLVPLPLRGRYFGLRNMVMTAVAMGTAFATGWIFDRWVASGRRDAGFAWIFGAAVLSSTTAGLLLSRQWEPPLRGEFPRSWLATLRRPFADRSFRRLLRFLVAWALAIGVASPFYGAHMIQNLRMPFSVIAVYSILAGAVGLVSQPLWGRLIDRVGNRPVLICNLAGIALLPLLWILATPTRLLPIWIDALLTGVFWHGMALSTFSLLLATAPEEGRGACLGVHSLAVGLAGFVASLAGGAMAEALGTFDRAVLGLPLINYHLLFALTVLLRLLLLPAAFRLREDRAQPVMTLLGVIGDKVLNELQSGLRAGTAVVRRIGRKE